MSPPMNLRQLRPSRKRLFSGDVFTMQLIDRFLFGRVISTDAVWTFAEGAGPAVLIYIYRQPSAAKVAPAPSAMRPEQLLVPPIMTNRLPWVRGYFETLANVPLDSGDVLAQHCFLLNQCKRRYYDEHGVELPRPVPPVGDYGLHSFRTIDDQISEALGIELAPEE